MDALRNHGIPTHLGDYERRYYQLWSLFQPSELSSFLTELAGRFECNEAALRMLPVVTDAAGNPLSSPAREALFRSRVGIAESHLDNVNAPVTLPPGSRTTPGAGLAVATATTGLPPTPEPPAAYPVARGTPGPTHPADPADACLARCAALTAARTAADKRRNAGAGPFEYFGTNSDPEIRKRNAAEEKRRRGLGYCYQCHVDDVKEIHFLECPLHEAGSPSNPSVRTITRSRRA